MPINFPSSPSVNDVYTYNGKSWIWNGSAWLAVDAINNTPIGNTTPSTGAFTTLSSTGNTTLGNIDSNLIPGTSNTYSLGNNTSRWTDIWLSNSTIHLGNANMSAEGSNLVLANSVSFNGSIMSETGGNLVLPANVTIGSTSFPTIISVQITDSSWVVKDDTAIADTGGYIIINGTNFASGSTVFVDELAPTQATSVSFVSSSLLRCQLGPKTSGTYNVYVVNPNGSTAIFVNGITFSSNPAWVTGSNLGSANVAASVNLSLVATDAVSYQLQDGSSLPPGFSLSSGGVITGAVPSQDIASTTTYNFTVEAIDAEFQESPRTFSITVRTFLVYSWGANVFGSGVTSSPVQIGVGNDWRQLSVSASAAVIAGTKQDSTLWIWGVNTSGQLGLNDRISRSSPTQVGTDTNWGKVAVSATYTYAIKSNGTLWVWGNNGAGNLGLNDVIYRSSPTQVGSLTGWTTAVPTDEGTVMMLRGTALFGVGDPSWGVLGLNGTVNIRRSSPVQVGGAWTAVSMGTNMVFGIKSGSTLWSWGNNLDGELGLGDLIRRSSPTQVGAASTWRNVSALGITIMATGTDGTLWCWGDNSYGQNGIGFWSSGLRSPGQVGTDTNWDKVSAGSDTSSAIKTNGTLWSWGRNNTGQLGLYNTINRSSPVQVGTATDWSEIYNYGPMIALKLT